MDLLCVRYEDLVGNPEKELHRITDFLGLEYEPWMAEGEGNREGVLERSYGWKGRAFDRITSARVGQWRQQLTSRQIHDFERWGGRALRALGYELTTAGRDGCPPTAYLRASWKTLTWRSWQAWRLARRLVRGGESLPPSRTGEGRAVPPRTAEVPASASSRERPPILTRVSLCGCATSAARSGP
jgi:hypothetical protein